MVAKIVHSTTVTVDLTLEELAVIIVGLGSEDQARLISLMAEAANFSVPMQLQYVVDDDAMTEAGRHLMRLIGDYGSPYPATQGGEVEA